jgi:hypothetical protein
MGLSITYTKIREKNPLQMNDSPRKRVFMRGVEQGGVETSIPEPRIPKKSNRDQKAKRRTGEDSI